MYMYAILSFTHTAVQAWQDEETDTNRAEETGHVSKLIPNNEETSRSHGIIHTMCSMSHVRLLILNNEIEETVDTSLN